MANKIFSVEVLFCVSSLAVAFSNNDINQHFRDYIRKATQLLILVNNIEV